jgi:hypothetical protein
MVRQQRQYPESLEPNGCQDPVCTAALKPSGCVLPNLYMQPPACLPMHCGSGLTPDGRRSGVPVLRVAAAMDGDRCRRLQGGLMSRFCLGFSREIGSGWEGARRFAIGRRRESPVCGKHACREAGDKREVEEDDDGDGKWSSHGRRFAGFGYGTVSRWQYVGQALEEWRYGAWTASADR